MILRLIGKIIIQMNGNLDAMVHRLIEQRTNEVIRLAVLPFGTLLAIL